MSIADAVKPLRMIFWGGLLCVLDFTFSSTSSINGRVATGFRFDILNDFVGMVLITIAIDRLSAFAMDSSYRTAMKFVYSCCLFNCVKALADHFVFRTPLVLGILSHLLGLATLAATVVFCKSMKRLAYEHGLHRSTASWAKTLLLIVTIWVVPLGLFYSVALLAMLTGQSFHFDIGIFVIPVLFILCMPLVHLFISTSRMRDEARKSEFTDNPPPVDFEFLN